MFTDLHLLLLLTVLDFGNFSKFGIELEFQTFFGNWI